MKLKKQNEVEIGRKLWFMLNDYKIKMKHIIEETGFSEEEIRNYIKIYTAAKKLDFVVSHNYGDMTEKYEYEERDIKDYFKKTEAPKEKEDKINSYELIERYFGKNWDKDDD